MFCYLYKILLKNRYYNINILPTEIQYLTNLQKLYLSHILPIEIQYLTNLKYLSYNKINSIYIPLQVIRFLNRIKNIDNLQVYNDTQNIHNH